jgi:hypothetical protein
MVKRQEGVKEAMKKNFPMQPIVLADDNVVRFKGNRIVRAFLAAAQEGKKLDLNDIAIKAAHGEFTDAEQMQFAQLIGYSVSGFGDLSYVDRKVLRRADLIADKVWKARKK